MNLTRHLSSVDQSPPVFAAALTSYADVSAADWSESCMTYVTGLDMPDEEFPDVWKSALIFLAAASALMTFTNFTAVISVCVQAIFRKSIFTVSGLIQSVAGRPSRIAL